jgi:hypothetical protein
MSGAPSQEWGATLVCLPERLGAVPPVSPGTAWRRSSLRRGAYRVKLAGALRDEPPAPTADTVTW